MQRSDESGYVRKWLHPTDIIEFTRVDGQMRAMGVRVGDVGKEVYGQPM